MGKMTQETVMEMRRLYGEGATQGALARHFGVGIAQVGRIVRGECWQQGAGLRKATQAEADATLTKLLRLQEQVEARQAAEADPLVRELFGTPGRDLPPPMLTEGGDAAAEVQGAADKMQKDADAMGLGMDKLLADNPLLQPGGAYDFIRKEKK